MNTCETCVNWRREEPGYGYYEGLGECIAARSLHPKPRKADVAMLDTYHEDARLMTGPSFGCIHWQARPSFLDEQTNNK